MSRRHIRKPLVGFGIAVLGFYLLFWGSQILFPGGTAGTVILVLTTLAGFAFIQPGWNIWPSRPVEYWAVLFGLLLGSAAFAVCVLTSIKIPTPYDSARLTIFTILPGVVAVTGIEELLFRQVMFRWLEQHQISGGGAVLTTSIAFAGAHLGPLLTVEPVGRVFYLLQSLYMLWVGLLFGELRRVSDSWTISWVGHIGYNVAVLLLLSQR
ncbi:MAG: CPBP family glutamic-type intramembrane protease [Nitrospira sp.]|nr:CPBP family glutamic-type intramembrane protease [Nitrospira sp.]